MEDKVKNIQSVQRALDILNCIYNAKQSLSIKEISERLDINVNTVRGLANTLLQNGYLSKNKNGKEYFLGLEFLSKSNLLYEKLVKKTREIAKPYMQAVADQYNVSCRLQISHHDIYTVDTIVSTNCHYICQPTTESRLPLHSTASGKLHLAFVPSEERKAVVEKIKFVKYTKNTITEITSFYRELDHILAVGYATEFEETDLGISSIAVPLFNSRNMLAGTLSIVAPAPIIYDVHKKAIIDLIKAGNTITSDISKKAR